VHEYDEKSEFTGKVWYYSEYESIVQDHTLNFQRVGENEHGAVCAKICLTLKNWNKLKKVQRGAIFEDMRATAFQLKLF
jgi:hypothetical protein